MDDARPVLHVPARDIPIPTSVSEEAQAILAMPAMGAPDEPAVDDLDGWRAAIAEHDASIAALMADRVADAPVTTTTLDVGGVTVHEIVPDDLAADDRRIYLDIHGGAFVYGAGASCRAMAVGAANRVGARVWAVDYRMPPDHPFPAGLDDCLTAYTAILEDHRPEEVVVGGPSAGGNLAAALLLRARDEGLPLPAAAVLMTPGVDLTASRRLAAHEPGAGPAARPRRLAHVPAVRRRPRPDRPLRLPASTATSPRASRRRS